MSSRTELQDEITANLQPNERLETLSELCERLGLDPETVSAGDIEDGGFLFLAVSDT